MKYTSTFLWLSAALLSAAPADKTLNLSIYDTTATSFLNRAFTVSGNNGKVLGISGGDWALVTASGSSSLTSTQIAYGDGSNVQTSEAAFAYNSTFNILSVDAIKLFATGVGISAASSGVLKLEGLGSGFDEAINMDFDTTSNVVRTSSPATGVTIMDYLDMSLRVTDGGGNFATLGPSGITVHNSAWAGNYTLDFGGTDGANEEIASKEWVTANAAAFDATAVDAVTWSDGANASNVWTFNLSGTDPTITFASGAVNVSTGALQVAGVAVPTISSTSTLTNKTLTSPAYTEVAIAALDIDWSAGSTFTKTLSANSTFTFSNLANGKTVTVALTNTASNYTVTWPTVSWPGSVAPTQTIGAKTDIYSFWRINGVVYGSYVQNF